MIKSFRADRSGQTVQTQIRLLLDEQSDQGLHCLLFHLHLFDEISLGFASFFEFTVMIQSFRADRSGQTVQTQIRLLLDEQSDQGLHCLLFHLHLFDEIPWSLVSFPDYKGDYSKVF